MTPSARTAVALALLLSGCTGGDKAHRETAATAPTASASSQAPSSPAAGAQSSQSSPSLPTPPDGAQVIPPAAGPPMTYGGQGAAWPAVSPTAAPPAYGAVLTRRVAGLSTGGTLAAGLLLPRLDASSHAPLVMTPCGRRVRLRAADIRLVPPGSGGALPKPAKDVVVLIDPGHGGAADGAIGVDGSREAARVLDLATKAARYAGRQVGRVYLTRTRDINATLEFRTTLGDALRVDAAIAVHLNAEGFTPLDRPGVETYGALSNRQGRRLAGVTYEAQRRFLQRFPGPWVGYRDAGAKYRVGRGGRDYYGLLRRSHRPWVISESMFMTSAHDIALLDKSEFVSQLAHVIADSAVEFTTTRAAGSGWVTPRPDFPAAPEAPGPRPAPCVDPAR